MSPIPFSPLRHQYKERRYPKYQDSQHQGTLPINPQIPVRFVEPAPDIACIVTTLTFANGPNVSCNAFNGTTNPVVLQFAFVTMNPR